MSDQLLQEILDRVKEASEQANTNAQTLAVLQDRMNHHMDVEHRDFNALLDVVRQGKAAAKVITILIAALAGIASFAGWVIDHLRIH